MKKITISGLLLLLPLTSINAASCPLAETGIGNISIPFGHAIYSPSTNNVYTKGVTCFYDGLGPNIIFNKPIVYPNAVATGSAWQDNAIFKGGVKTCQGEGAQRCSFTNS